MPKSVETDFIAYCGRDENTLTVRLADGTVHRFTLELAGARIAWIHWNDQRIQVRRSGGRGARASAIPSARRP